MTPEVATAMMEAVENKLSICIIRWRRISLHQLTEDNLPLLFKWRNSSSFLNTLTARKELSTLDEFKTELKRDFSTDRHLQFVIFANGKCVGTIYSYSLNKIDKYCFLSVYTDDNLQGIGYGIEATIAFCKYLFFDFQVFKIYFDIYEYNKKLISTLKKRNISIEGQLKKQHIFNGRRFDVLRFAIYRSDITNWILEHE